MRPEDFNNYTPRALGEEEARRAAVLIPLVDTPEGRHILFQVRSGRIEHQPGDVCFPGGMREKGEMAEENALRETREELLLLPEQIHLLGPMDYLVAGGLVVEPFLGVLEGYPLSPENQFLEMLSPEASSREIIPPLPSEGLSAQAPAAFRTYRGTRFNPSEVSEVFTVPLDFFLTHEPEVYTAEYHMELPPNFPYHRIQKGRDYRWRPREEKIYFWQVGEHTIWGMTARILRGFLRHLKE